MTTSTPHDKPTYAYVSPLGFEDDLISEVGVDRVTARFGRLIVVNDGPMRPVWSHNTWFNPEVVKIESINDAVKKLKSRGYLWTHLAFQSTGRAKLILEKLPKVFQKDVVFGESVPKRNLGAFSLLNDSEMIVSQKTLSPFENGEFTFEENKVDPPSRAYLKLWEWLTLNSIRPTSNDVCYDLGSCPGGWTWVLAPLCQKVVSVDKAPLDDKLKKFKNVEWIKKDAFSIDPTQINEVDWVFSDIISEPERIYELAQKWISHSKAKHLVFTVKFKGETKQDVIRQMLDIPNSKAIHLYHNKHEITWWWNR